MQNVYQTQSENGADQIQDGIQDIIQFQKILRACSPPSLDGKDNFGDDLQTTADIRRSLTKKDIQNIKVLIQNGFTNKNSDLGLSAQQTLKFESIMTFKGDSSPAKLKKYENMIKGKTQLLNDNF